MPHLLILGGTSEASHLAQTIRQAGQSATVSLAGRVANPAKLPLPVRIGGFGGVAGLVDYLRQERVTHVIDATHPFAAQISANAVAACDIAQVPLIALDRPQWQAGPEDRWISVPDMAGAVAALDLTPRRVFLAVGRMHLAEFLVRPEHFYLLRLVDPPPTPPLFPHHQVIVARGPFTEKDDLALMGDHGIDLIVSKNSGGSGASAKITAARRLGLPVIMIERPVLPPRHQVDKITDVMAWIAHHSTDLGV